MTQPVIVFEHVSKTFDLQRARSRSLQELVVNFGRGREARARDELGALKDVSFAIEQGETVGFIGANGAGKSTVLKLIARILEPDAGRVTVNGRVGALLELGAGFHPDLTGRENIYLNASIMGFSRRDVERRLDEIIAFAELERFIDVPVKHYSSGMYVRLGFAVAVHTEPEILLVDEVLAVGDAAFQRKCMDKIAEFKRAGRVIIFVSHDMGLLQSLCQQLIWFEEGRVHIIGDADRVIAAYIHEVSKTASSNLIQRNMKTLDTPAQKHLRISEVFLLNAQDERVWDFESGEAVRFCLRYEATTVIEKPVFSILIHRVDGLYISTTNTYNVDPFAVGPLSGTGELRVQVASLDLYEGDYLLSVGAYYEPDPPFWPNPADFLDKEYTFHVRSDRGCHGVLVLPATWQHYSDERGE